MKVVDFDRPINRLATSNNEPLYVEFLNTRQAGGKLVVRVLAASLNVEDLHIARGWCPG